MQCWSHGEPPSSFDFWRETNCNFRQWLHVAHWWLNIQFTHTRLCGSSSYFPFPDITFYFGDSTERILRKYVNSVVVPYFLRWPTDVNLGARFRECGNTGESRYLSDNDSPWTSRTDVSSIINIASSWWSLPVLVEIIQLRNICTPENLVVVFYIKL